jgi:hypothetical protein
LFRCFGSISQKPKQTDLFPNKPKKRKKNEEGSKINNLVHIICNPKSIFNCVDTRAGHVERYQLQSYRFKPFFLTL